ncbi:hypothetical protein [Rhodoflexus caldus]|uniref:hypothetical protein n=1 Tax=Rhodoflexus caldus TaxID=2891236 RepID=UPI00202A60FB|nr:hypothetical protein [Rhodoflexus caldus]
MKRFKNTYSGCKRLLPLPQILAEVQMNTDLPEKICESPHDSDVNEKNRYQLLALLLFYA